ncbi:hypothetical protein Mgra_00008200 [Meloidogyne graminicola]|uniref:Uncharacterized protein n=1 Tax=Meloidogyne graminicola TaxID=189291 RepID=A0A8S9ZGH1_9BILA|nr:hypothetical protein Mgra_00008200 [Meloidogyne graminicola]
MSTTSFVKDKNFGYSKVNNIQSPSTSAGAFRTSRDYWNTSGYSTPASFTSRFSTNTAGEEVGCFSSVRMTATAKLGRYLRRLLHARQMDFEFAAWQMLYLMINPQKVYRNFMYRKKTKDQWARDDPAFLVLLAFSLFWSSVLFAFALGLSISAFVTFFLWAVFIDCIGVGLVIATILWYISNRYLRRVKDQDVEWGYCFDVHLNAFFPLLICLHVILPLLFYGLIDYQNFAARALGNSIWCIAVIYYIYITFLGYTALPILKNTHFFLYPITFLFIFFVATISAGWNITQTFMDFYHYRATNLPRRQP